MLPTSKDGRDLFSRMREMQSQVRQRQMDWFKIDMDEIKRREAIRLELVSELVEFRECVEFMLSEGMLTKDQEDAANNVIGWADVLKGSL